MPNLITIRDDADETNIIDPTADRLYGHGTPFGLGWLVRRANGVWRRLWRDGSTWFWKPCDEA
jgi:hypothetical protein